MFKNKFARSGRIALVALALAAAPLAQAQPRNDVELGAAIAAQGNRALETIRAEVRRSLQRSSRPALPDARRVSTTPVAPGGTTATVRCAE